MTIILVFPSLASFAAMDAVLFSSFSLIILYFEISQLSFFESFLISLSSNAASKNKETYEYLDLFGQIFDRVRSSYVDKVTDEELIEKYLVSVGQSADSRV